jgi:hypothetical protein
MHEDEPLTIVKVKNSTPESDGSFKDYFIRVDPRAYRGKASKVAQAAVASTWRDEDGELFFENYEDYVLTQQS